MPDIFIGKVFSRMFTKFPAELIGINRSVLHFQENTFLLIRIEQLFGILHSYLLKALYSLAMVQVDQDASQIEYYIFYCSHIPSSYFHKLTQKPPDEQIKKAVCKESHTAFGIICSFTRSGQTSKPNPVYSKLWITKPERSLGSNQVVLGGMILPVSAISINCFIVTG